MAATTTWQGTLTAVSSVAHAGETRGTITLLRRELIQTAGGPVHVPVVSGNTLRGRLRRIGEELLRDQVGYEGLVPAAAAHALRGGGALAKSSGEPLSGSRLARLRALVPLIGVFGAAGGGTIISGALDVGKVVPHVAETARITGVQSEQSAFTATQLEAYTRQDDAGSHDFVPVNGGEAAGLHFDEQGYPQPLGGNQMLFHLETFPAGTVFSTWLRLRRPTPMEVGFFVDVLDAYRRDGRLGGRAGIGHGQVRVDLQPDRELGDVGDWRALVDEQRDQVLEVLQWLG